MAELRDGLVESYHITPEEFGISRRSLEGLSVGDASASATLIRAALSGDGSEAADKARDMIALNAGACIYVAGVASTLADGIALAQDLIATGQANEKLKSFVDFTQLMRGHKS